MKKNINISQMGLSTPSGTSITTEQQLFETIMCAGKKVLVKHRDGYGFYDVEVYRCGNNRQGYHLGATIHFDSGSLPMFIRLGKTPTPYNVAKATETVYSIANIEQL